MNLFNATDIFKAAGYNLKAMILNIVVIGGVMVVSAFVTMALVDRVAARVNYQETNPRRHLT